MNKSLSLLLLCLLTFTGMLSAQHKRASDACPGVNNKPSTGQYASLSQRSGQNSSFSSPRYQHLYAKSRYQSTAGPVTRSSNSRSKTKSKETKEVLRPAAAPAEKNPSSRSIREEKNKKQQGPAVKEDEFPGDAGTDNVSDQSETKSSVTAPSETKALTRTPENNGVMAAEPAVNKDPKPDSSANSNVTSPKSGSASANTSDNKIENKNPYTRNMTNTSAEAKESKKHKNNSKKKKSCFGKKSADSCPEF
ncbi:MAG: hypothetical protein ACJ77K_16500 [Bacteroidia bacterium]